MGNVKEVVQKGFKSFKSSKKAFYLSLLAIPFLIYLGIYIYSLTQNHTYKFSKEEMAEGASFEDFNLVVQDQKYNPTNGTYVIKIKADSDNDEKVILDKNNLSVKAITNKERKTYKPNVYHTLNDYFIVELEDIPKNYGSLKLHFKYKNNKSDEEGLDKEKESDLYVSALGKNIDKSLRPKSKKEYYKESYMYLNDKITKGIKDKQKDIKDNKDNIKRLKKENKKLDPSDPVLSKKEQMQTRSKLDDNNSSIDSSKEEIHKDKKEIKEKEKNKQSVEKIINNL
ncbi:hypothetical protein [Staphylococcus sp. RIT622]|uniref:hypothetical protein n=1 Tax=Staphylococcus sp. RIT622 TaxID=2510795 RepID=UPI00101E8372|nr:hypothetical protein [Staphylococcus sp. RIT622]MCG2544229.1 hypothetical protein [Staphylococcus epidermidis]RYL09504.1 hypothetical protein EU553_11730 [Staphylococcus sp. RIT622]